MNSITAPTHLAIIPDGNRRWARANKFDIFGGYQRGAKQFENIMRSAFKKGVRYLSFWAASTDNLKGRSDAEVEILCKLLKQYLKKLSASKELKDKQIQVKLIGQGLKIINDPELNQLAAKIEKQTKNYKKRKLNILFGYDGQEEMLSALSDLKKKDCDVRSSTIKQALWTGESPDVDLVIRTGDDPHWSAGFMMWHCANSQLYFSKTLWPDFKEAELKKALATFSKSRRLKGK